METRKTIHSKHLPIRMPTIQTVVAWLLLENTDWPGWASGVIWSVVALLWLTFVYSIWAEDAHELVFKDKK